MNRPVQATDLAAALPACPPPSPAESARVLDLRALTALLWQRRWVVALCTLLSAGATQAALDRIAPRYTATAEVMLNNRQTNVVEMDRVVGDLGGHDMAANEQRVLTSQRLLLQVIDRLRLDRDPEFNPLLRPDPALRRWRDGLAGLLSAGPLAGLLAPTPNVPDLSGAQERLAVIQSFRDALSVAGVPRTRAITVSVTSEDPAKAALVANTLADLYIIDQLETKFEATRRASAWLNRRLGELKSKVERSEAAVVAFKAGQAIGTGQGADLTAQQIAELNTELITARASLAEARARAGQIERRVREGGIGAAASVLSSELILRLRTGLAELIRREAELGTRYGAKHPAIVNVRAEIADARGAIAAEVRKTIEGLRNDVAVAEARAAALETSLGELEDRSVVLSRSSVALRQLEREASADRLIYETFMNRFRETTEQEDLQSADARLLSAATPPLEPSAPKRRKILAIAGAIGLMLGLGLAMLLETLASTFRAASEVSERTGLPVLASLPRQGRRRDRRRVLDYIRDRPNSALSEGVRALRTALLLSDIDRPPQVVMITSSVPGEGKSTTCLMLAHLSNQMNRRAIVVDCDIRRPTLHRSFGIAGDTGGAGGLIGVLEETCTLDDAIIEDPETCMHVLATLQPVPQAADILSSARFRKLIDELRERYDLVLLDTPPALLVSDAGAVGRIADTAIYAVRWNSTPREAAAKGLGSLRELGVEIAGCVVTLTDRRREAKYAHARYGEGYGYAGQNAYYVN